MHAHTWRLVLLFVYGGWEVPKSVSWRPGKLVLRSCPSKARGADGVNPRPKSKDEMSWPATLIGPGPPWIGGGPLLWGGKSLYWVHPFRCWSHPETVSNQPWAGGLWNWHVKLIVSGGLTIAFYFFYRTWHCLNSSCFYVYYLPAPPFWVVHHVLST